MSCVLLDQKDRAEACASICRGLVSLTLGVGPNHLGNPERNKSEVSFARQAAMYLTHVVFGISLSHVGPAFGRDRSTASYACRKIEDERSDPRVDALLERVTAATLMLCPEFEVHPVSARL